MLIRIVALVLTFFQATTVSKPLQMADCNQQGLIGLRLVNIVCKGI